MKGFIVLSLLTYTCLANANNSCPNGFVFDENRELCININNPDITAESSLQCTPLIYKEICHYPD